MIRRCALFFSGIVFLLIISRDCLAFVGDSPAIMRRIADGNMCALTFDDGPSQFTPKLLDSLHELGVKATFFVLGVQAETRPELIKRMLAEGHEVASHSYSHPNFRKLSPQDQYVQLSQTKLILENLGAQPRYFRPPYGNYTHETINIASDLGMSIMLWSTDSRDWKRRPKDYGQMNHPNEKKYYLSGLRGVFLFHDTKKNTVDDLPIIVNSLAQGGCDRFVTVSEYFYEDQPPSGPMTIQAKAAPLAKEKKPDGVSGFSKDGALPASEKASLPAESAFEKFPELPAVKSSTEKAPVEKASARAGVNGKVSAGSSASKSVFSNKEKALTNLDEFPLPTEDVKPQITAAPPAGSLNGSLQGGSIGIESSSRGQDVPVSSRGQDVPVSSRDQDVSVGEHMYHVRSTPAGSTPIPMARSLRIMQRPHLHRGSNGS